MIKAVHSEETARCIYCIFHFIASPIPACLLSLVEHIKFDDRNSGEQVTDSRTWTFQNNLNREWKKLGEWQVESF
jgi:hypothetical protein